MREMFLNSKTMKNLLANYNYLNNTKIITAARKGLIHTKYKL